MIIPHWSEDGRLQWEPQKRGNPTIWRECNVKIRTLLSLYPIPTIFLGFPVWGPHFKCTPFVGACIPPRSPWIRGTMFPQALGTEGHAVYFVRATVCEDPPSRLH